MKKGTDAIIGATSVARHAGDLISEITFANDPQAEEAIVVTGTFTSTRAGVQNAAPRGRPTSRPPVRAKLGDATETGPSVVVPLSR